PVSPALTAGPVPSLRSSIFNSAAVPALSAIPAFPVGLSSPQPSCDRQSPAMASRERERVRFMEMSPIHGVEPAKNQGFSRIIERTSPPALKDTSACIEHKGGQDL